MATRNKQGLRADLVYGTASYKAKRLRNWITRGVKISSYTEYEYILEQQGHKCAICNTHVNGNGCLDHDHETGLIRGILCRPCNVAVEYMANKMQIASNYLENFQRSNFCNRCHYQVDLAGDYVDSHWNGTVYHVVCFREENP